MKSRAGRIAGDGVPTRPGADAPRGTIYNRIGKEVAAGDFGTGDLVTEWEFADLMGVSRTPAREAPSPPVAEGLLDPSGRGGVVAELTDEDVAQLYEVRRLLEPHAIALCIDHLTKHDLAAMTAALTEQREAHQAGDADRFVEANETFRQICLAHVPNPYLRTQIERYDDHVSWLRQATSTSDATRRIMLVGLERLLGALQAGDRGEAAAIVTGHLTAAERALRVALGRIATPAG